MERKNNKKEETIKEMKKWNKSTQKSRVQNLDKFKKLIENNKKKNKKKSTKQ